LAFSPHKSANAAENPQNPPVVAVKSAPPPPLDKFTSAIGLVRSPKSKKTETAVAQEDEIKSKENNKDDSSSSEDSSSEDSSSEDEDEDHGNDELTDQEDDTAKDAQDEHTAEDDHRPEDKGDDPKDEAVKPGVELPNAEKPTLEVPNAFDTSMKDESSSGDDKRIKRIDTSTIKAQFGDVVLTYKMLLNLS